MPLEGGGYQALSSTLSTKTFPSGGLDLNWAVGFVDSEGCFSVIISQRSNAKWRVRVCTPPSGGTIPFGGLLPTPMRGGGSPQGGTPPAPDWVGSSRWGGAIRYTEGGGAPPGGFIIYSIWMESK